MSATNTIVSVLGLPANSKVEVGHHHGEPYVLTPRARRVPASFHLVIKGRFADALKQLSHLELDGERAIDPGNGLLTCRVVVQDHGKLDETQAKLESWKTNKVFSKTFGHRPDEMALVPGSLLAFKRLE